MNRLKLAVSILLALLFVGFVSCAHATFLPWTEKVNITGTEVKRLDATEKNPSVRDRRYILATRVTDNEPLSFANEDTRWGWPPYFKFNSADLSAQAQEIVQKQKEAVVLVKLYGYRSTVLDEFPNVISMRVVDKDYTHIPVFNILFYVIVFGIFGGGYFFIRRFLKRRAEKKAAASPSPA